MSRVRLFTDRDITPLQEITLSKEQSHYLVNVMRLGNGDTLLIFNGRDGEYSAEIVDARKRSAILSVGERTAEMLMPPDLWLVFAPIKKARTDFIVEKATELGVRHIQPVITRFTNSERLRTDRLRAHAVEAAEQCGGTFVPEVAEPVKLDTLLEGWETDRSLIFCDEAREAAPLQQEVQHLTGPAAILVGPEGGFAPDEVTSLKNKSFVCPVSLGPRILRADTAAVAAISIWQAVKGDW